MPKRSISHADLKRAQLPGPRSSWEEIQIFALTFNGYERIGERLTELANRHLEAGTVPSDIPELRGCVFFEQRRWHAQDDNPDAATMRHVWAPIEGIRAALEQIPVKW